MKCKKELVEENARLKKLLEILKRHSNLWDDPYLHHVGIAVFEDYDPLDFEEIKKWLLEE